MIMDSFMPLRPAHAVNESHFSCPTCQDQGLPGRVLAIDAATNTATVKMAEGENEVALDLVDGVTVGDFVLVHIGTAIAKLNPNDIIETED